MSKIVERFHLDERDCFPFQVLIHNWRQLCWPDLVDSFPFVLRLVKDVAQLAQFYALHIYEETVKEGVFKTQDNLPGIPKNRQRQVGGAWNRQEGGRWNRGR